MIVLTIGKNAFPEYVSDTHKHIQEFVDNFHIEYNYPIIYVNDDAFYGIKIGFRFKDNKGIPLSIVDDVINRIKSAFNVY